MDLKFYYNKIINRVILSVIIILIISLEFSCSNIIDSPNNHIKQRIELNLTRDDSLSTVQLDQLDLGTITKPRERYYNMTLTNTSEYDTIYIYDIKTDVNTGISIIPLTSYPLILLPVKSVVNPQFIVYLQTYNISAGNYTYKIFLNESADKFFTLKVDVLP